MLDMKVTEGVDDDDVVESDDDVEVVEFVDTFDEVAL